MEIQPPAMAQGKEEENPLHNVWDPRLAKW